MKDFNLPVAQAEAAISCAQAAVCFNAYYLTGCSDCCKERDAASKTEMDILCLFRRIVC